MTVLCPYFGRCGGCSYQDVAYPEQFARKEKLLRELLAAKNIAWPEQYAAYPAPSPYFYRTRMDFAFHLEGPGLRRRKSFSHVIPIQRCLLAAAPLNIVLAEVREWFLQNKLKDFWRLNKKGALKYATVRAAQNTGDASVTFVLNSDDPDLPRHIEAVKNFQSGQAASIMYGALPANGDLSVLENPLVARGSEMLREKILGVEIWYHSQAFFQNNIPLLEKMLYWTRAGLSDSARGLLIDLYGGAGTFGLTLGRDFERVQIIDSSAQNIAIAGQNIAANKIQNTAVFCGKAEAVEMPVDKDAVLIVDPPRAGLHPDVMRKIFALQPARLIYISCNPRQLVSDLPLLQERYHLAQMALFDFFPQTEHLETAVILNVK